MQRLVGYAQSALKVHKRYPVVLIFCTERVSPHLMAKFEPVAEQRWMSSLSATDFWAKSCHIVSKRTLSCIDASDELTPLQALSLFLTEGSPTLFGHSFAEDRTIQHLYQLAMSLSENLKDNADDVSNVVDITCYNNERMLLKTDAALFGVPGSSKAKKLIKRALDFNAAAKRKYCETVGTDSDTSLEQLPKLKGKKRAVDDSSQDDLDYIMNFRSNTVGKMNWNLCLTAAHENNLCQRFSTGETLRRFFYNSSNRSSTKKKTIINT